MVDRLSHLQRLRRRVNRRLYRGLFRFYRTLFPTSGDDRERLRGGAVSRILVVRHDRIGDMIVTTPALRLLADVAPGAQVDVLASQANAGVVEAHPSVHRVFVRTGWRDWLLLFPRLRRRRYDVIYSFIYGKGLREGLVASAIALRHTRKISVMRPTRYHGLFTHVIRVPRSLQHMAEHLSHVVRQSIAAADERPSASYPMQLAADAKAEERATAFLAGVEPTEVVVVNIAAAEPWREWPWSNCVDVLRELLPRWPDVAFVLLSPPEKLSGAQRVVDACASDRVILFPPSRRFLDLVAIVSRARLVVTADTASVHVASACGRPVVALYSGVRTTTGLWSPFGVPARSVRAEPGRPVSTIPAEQIVHACEELYAETALLRA